MSSFTNSLIVSPLSDGKRWVIRREFNYDVGTEGSGDTVSVPVGFITDFASIPRIFWVIAPKWGKYGNAAVVHDYLYWTKSRSRKEADDIFLEGMAVLGVSKWKRYLIYWAVRIFGWIAFGKKTRESKKKIIEFSSVNIEMPDMDLKVLSSY